MLATDTPPPFAGLTPAPTPPPPGSAPTGRKRKQAPAQASTSTASTPPPEGSTPAPTTTIISDRSDLSTRERRTISRYPIFLPALNQPLASTSTPRSRSPSSSSADPDDDPLFYTTDGIPHNSLRFRYYPAGVNSPGAILTCRTIESLPCSYRISWEDRSPFLKVSRSGLRLLGDKGFRSARGNAPVREGRWYFEVKIEKGGGEPGARAEGAHVRLGWSRREAPLNAPVGVDGYSYAYRDKTGEKVTLSRPRPYGAPFRSGDTVGMYIALPPRRTPGTVRTRGGKEVPDPHDPANIRRNRIPIDFKGQEYFETLEYQASKEMISLMEAQSAKPSASASLPSAPSKKSGATVKNMSNARAAAASAKKAQPELRPLPTLGPDSCLAFFVNGVCQGVAFRDLYDYLPLRAPNDAAAAQRHRKKRDGGTHHEHAPNPFDDGTLGYYPTLSLFNDARVRLNPGPDFEYPPPDDVDAVLAEHERKRQGEGEDDKSQLKMDVDADIKPSTQRTWRPLCERYPEYMAEQWALDDEEEARA
ncbi:hypothetical protein PUNSTDRAFT_70408, partial [Punctularia strigosozonata HHB-11173 SS5]|uniref:uncharacterized protein n=1 Tax=Punctularia strigosozonata (strain HHB-11173) TaxID=741275 RepID=UPI00044172FF